MTIYPTEDYRIKVNHNVALVSLVNIETIVPTNDRAFFAPQAYGYASPGQLAYRLYNSLGYRRGFPSIAWLFQVMTRLQYAYLSTTYCGGALSGLVTIYTTLGGNGVTYSRFNATIQLPSPAESPNGEYFAYRNMRVLFTHLVSI